MNWETASLKNKIITIIAILVIIFGLYYWLEYPSDSDYSYYDDYDLPPCPEGDSRIC